jgi:hypothetical protein
MSTVKTSDPHSSCPFVSLVESEGMSENTEGDPDAPEAAAEGDVRKECSFD